MLAVMYRSAMAEDILVGVCTHCDTVVAIPPEATLALQRLARLAV